jgi:DnaK suppressor protein
MEDQVSPHATHLDEATLARLRLRLEHERQRLTQLLGHVGHEAEVADRDEPADAGDLATRFGPPDVENQLHAQYEARRQAVVRALARMQAGVYGISERTGEPIPLQRLEAVPWAAD